MSGYRIPWRKIENQSDLPALYSLVITSDDEGCVHADHRDREGYWVYSFGKVIAWAPLPAPYDPKANECMIPPTDAEQLDWLNQQVVQRTREVNERDARIKAIEAMLARANTLLRMAVASELARAGDETTVAEFRNRPWMLDVGEWLKKVGDLKEAE